MLPESPRYLVSKDRDDEARAILVKYHAEGDANSLLVQAEVAQIRETIKTEMEVSKQSWMELLQTAGMRRRFLVTIFIGLFTQLSGNTLLSYYSGILFGMMGYTTNYAKTRINLANACWGLLNATIIAFVVVRFKRRLMYMTSAILMLLVFIGITVSLQSMQVAQDAGVTNASAGIAGLFFYFAFSPAYNIGNNALTYSKSSVPTLSVPKELSNMW
jgi:glucan phosphoethanolaminetransferase (alkaline phosphatase superfamily)